MPSKALTDRFVAGIRRTVRTNYFDKKARGLTLRVQPSGLKVWWFVYRTNGQPSQWLRLGDHPALKLAEARKLALAQRHAIDVEGKDPAAERRMPAPEPVTEPLAFTFADFVPAYVAFQKGRKRTWADDAAKIDKYLLPAWGPRPLRSLTRAHVHELLDTIAGKGLTIGVNRVQALVSRIFTVALDRSLIDAHPAARLIKRFSETAGTRTLADEELRALWAGLDAQPGPAADAIRLRLLLGQRGGETAGMLWSELNLAAGEWNLPPSRTKNKRPHMIPLSPIALALLERRRAAVHDDATNVFPGLTLSSDAHRALGVLHGGRYEWKDLRRTVATRLAGLGFDETTIGRVLNHARVTVTAKHYNQHAYLDETRRALEAWDRELQRILTHKAKSKAAVLRMRAR